MQETVEGLQETVGGLQEVEVDVGEEDAVVEEEEEAAAEDLKKFLILYRILSSIYKVILLYLGPNSCTDHQIFEWNTHPL